MLTAYRVDQHLYQSFQWAFGSPTEKKSQCSFNIFIVRMPQKKFSKKQRFILLENVESIPDICKEILQIVQNRY
jgi:hypothetical protein